MSALIAMMARMAMVATATKIAVLALTERYLRYP